MSNAFNLTDTAFATFSGDETVAQLRAVAVEHAPEIVAYIDAKASGSETAQDLKDAIDFDGVVSKAAQDLAFRVMLTVEDGSFNKGEDIYFAEKRAAEARIKAELARTDALLYGSRRGGRSIQGKVVHQGRGAWRRTEMDREFGC